MTGLTDRELLLVAVDKVTEVAARCIRIETRVSKLLLELGMKADGSAVVTPRRMPEKEVPSCHG